MVVDGVLSAGWVDSSSRNTNRTSAASAANATNKPKPRTAPERRYQGTPRPPRALPAGVLRTRAEAEQHRCIPRRRLRRCRRRRGPHSRRSRRGPRSVLSGCDLGNVVGLRPGERPERARHRRRGRVRHQRGHRGGGGRRHRRWHLRTGAAHRLKPAADRGRQLGLCRGDDGHPQVLGQRRGDDRDARAAADRRDGDQVTWANSAALQRVLQFGDETGERCADRVVEFVAGDPDSLRCRAASAGSDVTAAVDSRSLAPRHCARSRVSEPIAEVPDRSIDPAADRSPIDWVSNAWSMRSPERSRWRTVGPIGANPLAASASVMLVPVPPKSQSAMTPRWAPRVVLQRRERRGGIGRQQRGRSARGTPGLRRGRRAARRRPRVASARDRSRRPVRPGGRPPTSVRKQRPQRLGEQDVGSMRRAVRRDDCHRVADPVDEVGDDQPASVRLGFSLGTPDLGGPVRIARQDRRPRHRGPADVTPPPGWRQPTESPIPTCHVSELCLLPRSAADPVGSPSPAAGR